MTVKEAYIVDSKHRPSGQATFLLLPRSLQRSSLHLPSSPLTGPLTRLLHRQSTSTIHTWHRHPLSLHSHLLASKMSRRAERRRKSRRHPRTRSKPNAPYTVIKLTSRSSITDFPSAYEFSSVDDSEALARRQARFNQAPSAAHSGPVAQPVGVSGWFDTDTSGGFSQGGKKRLRGMGSSVFIDAQVMEEDPVSLSGSCFEFS